jgi:hypothetical protein
MMSASKTFDSGLLLSQRLSYCRFTQVKTALGEASLTPFACVVVGLYSVGVAVSGFQATAPPGFAAGSSLPLDVVMTAALVLTGPGAFSLDARLFGRREIIIPPPPRPPQS